MTTMNMKNQVLLMMPGAVESATARFSSLTAPVIAELSKRSAARDPRTGMKMYGNTAVVDVYGPLSTNISFYEFIMGYNDYNWVVADLRNALSDDNVKNIVLNFDSPGGRAMEMFEFSNLIKSAAVEKNIVAWVGGMACSAAYGMASACKRIYSTSAAMVGSIGTYIEIPVQEKPDQDGNKYITVTSTDSPLKNPDPRTEKGLAAYQKQVDSLTGQFIEMLAANRNVSVEFVREQFGQGTVFTGREALDHKMVDEVLSGFDELLTILNQGSANMSLNPSAKVNSAAKANAVSTDGAQPGGHPAPNAEEITSAAVQAALAGERERISALSEICVTAKSPADILAKAISDGTSVDALRESVLSARVTNQQINTHAAIGSSPEESHEKNVAAMAKLI